MCIICTGSFSHVVIHTFRSFGHFKSVGKGQLVSTCVLCNACTRMYVWCSHSFLLLLWYRSSMLLEMSRALELPLALSSSTHLPCAHIAPLLKGDHKLGTSSYKPLLSRSKSDEYNKCIAVVILYKVALFVGVSTPTHLYMIINILYMNAWK